MLGGAAFRRAFAKARPRARGFVLAGATFRGPRPVKAARGGLASCWHEARRGRVGGSLRASGARFALAGAIHMPFVLAGTALRDFFRVQGLGFKVSRRFRV